MAEEQPPEIHEGAPVADEPAPTGTADDRKAAAALSSLDQRGDVDGDTASDKKDVDTEALGKAMKNLDGGGKKDDKSATVQKKVKVEAADVTLVVCRTLLAGALWNGRRLTLTQTEQLELTKAKATELLKAHDGDAVKAMSAYVSASA